MNASPPRTRFAAASLLAGSLLAASLLAASCAAAPSSSPRHEACDPAPALQEAARLDAEGRIDRAARVLRAELSRCPGRDAVALPLLRRLVELGRVREARSLAAQGATRGAAFAAEAAKLLAQLDAAGPADTDALVGEARAAGDPISRRRLLDRARATLEERSGETGRAVRLPWRPVLEPYRETRHLLSPDDRLAVQAVTVVPSRPPGRPADAPGPQDADAGPAVPAGEPALVVRELSPVRPFAVRRLLLRGEATRPLQFLSPSRLLVKTGPGGAAVVDVETGEARTFPSAASPAWSPERGLLATVDPGGSVVILDAATLAERARARGAALAGALGEAVLTFPVPSRLLVKLGERGLLLDTATGAVLHDGPDLDIDWRRPRTSPSGRYFALARPAPPQGYSLEVAILDTLSSGRIVARLPGGQYLPGFGFSADEGTLISSPGIEALEVRDLRTGGTRRLPTGLKDAPGITFYFDRLALADDGRRICLGAAASVEKYGDCHPQPYGDLRRLSSKAAPGEIERCFIEGERARFVSFPRAALGKGRFVLPSLTGTYMRVCNQRLSPDGSLLAIADAAQRDDELYHDASLLLVDWRAGSIRHRIPLGDGPSSMGSVLVLDFSPSGRFLQVEWGEEHWRTIDVARGVALAAELSGGSFSPAERFVMKSDEEGTLAPVDGGPRFALAPANGGEACAFGSLLAPPEVCEEG